MKCNHCGCELIPDINWMQHEKEKHDYICYRCKKQYFIEYYQKHKTRLKKYAIINGKKWYRKNKEHIKEHKKQYRKTRKDKYIEYKTRRRKLGFNKIIENDWKCSIVWHHINNNDVVPIPKELHIMCQTGDREKHRETCNRMINFLYEGELKI